MKKLKTKSKIYIAIAVVAILIAVIVAIILFTNKSQKSTEQSNSNITVSNTSKESSKEKNKSKTNVEYFQNLKEKHKEIETLKINIVNEDEYYPAPVPLTTETLNKLGPFSGKLNSDDNRYQTWDDLLNSKETVKAGDKLGILVEGRGVAGYALLWNRESEDRTAKECFEDGDISITVTKFTFGLYSAEYLGKEEFTYNHEMLDCLFEQFGTPTYYRYLMQNPADGNLELIFDNDNFSIDVEIMPRKSEENGEWMQLQEITYFGGKSLEMAEKLEVKQNKTSKFTKTSDLNKMIEEYLKAAEEKE